jgi:hypothetical protein
LQLASFALLSGEGEIANTFNQAFSEEFHFKEGPRSLQVRVPLALGLALSELVDYKDRPAIAERYRKFLQQIESFHAAVVREAMAEMERAPSAEETKKVLGLQETHELLQKEMRKDEENRP